MTFNTHRSIVFRTHLDFILSSCFSFLLRNRHTEAGTMVQSAHCLDHKHENLGSDPQYPREKLGAVTYAWNQAAGQTGTAQWLTQYTAVLVSPWVSGRPCL